MTERESTPGLGTREHAVRLEEPSELGDHPYVHTNEDLLALLLSLTDEKAEEYEISRLSACYLTLRLNEPENLAVFYPTSISRRNRQSAVCSTRPSGIVRRTCPASCARGSLPT